MEVYRLLYRMNSNPEELATYFDVKNFLLSSYRSIHIKDQEVVLSNLLNFTASQIKRGNPAFRQEAFELYCFGLEGILTQDGYLSPTKFSNIVNTACMLKEFRWVESFVRDYEFYKSGKKVDSKEGRQSGPDCRDREYRICIFQRLAPGKSRRVR